GRGRRPLRPRRSPARRIARPGVGARRSDGGRRSRPPDRGPMLSAARAPGRPRAPVSHGRAEVWKGPPVGNGVPGGSLGRVGLLEPASRSSGGFRLYERRAAERVRWIDLLHAMGFSLQEMRGLLQRWWNSGLGTQAMEELRALFVRKLEETREAIARHQQIEG